jgi:HD-like signal output (HDOD) protein
MAGQESIRHDPRIEARAKHAKRVAAWTTAIARSLGASTGDQAVLENAALAQELSPILVDEPAWGRLLADLGVQTVGPSSVSADARRVLRFLRGAHPTDECLEETARIATILDQANRFDEHFEIEPFLDAEERPPADAMNVLQAPHHSTIGALKRCLPVLPAAARAAFGLLAKPGVDLEELNDVARRDQVLAVNVIEAANSGLWGSRQPVRDLRHAIARLGAENAKKVILAGALRPIYSSGALKQSWRHAQEAAETAERIARYTHAVPPPEAFLAGLVHDIGQLRFHVAAVSADQERRRLVEQGGPPRVVEQIVFGVDHASAGAELLHSWRFPSEFCEAVQFHHCPERTHSRMAALLYLVEFELSAEEDLPSLARLETACRRLNVSWSNGRFERNDSL